jgi:transposase
VYTVMNWWTKIRLEVLRGESSKREVLRREGIHWETLKKILSNPSPPGYQINRPRPRPKVGPFLEQIAQIIESDKAYPQKQRHTAMRIYERMKELGYGGGYTQIREAVREIRNLITPAIKKVNQIFTICVFSINGGHALSY